MNQEAAPQETAPKPKEHPFIDLVRHLTPDTSSKLKERLMPPKVGAMFAIGPFIFRVGYINAGKLQFSSEFYGLKLPEGIMRPGGAIEAQQPEPAKPTKNVTLEVHDGFIDQRAIFGQRAANGQNPTS